MNDHKNQYCKSTDLSNESSVESFFILRLLAGLGYQDSEIKPKRSIDAVNVAKGRTKESHKPDFLIVADGAPRWLIEAKAVNESIEDFTYQGAGYAFAVNRRSSGTPLRFYMMSNGLLTRVYAWDQEEAILSLRFGDFQPGNTKFEALKELLGADLVRTGWETSAQPQAGPVLRRPPLDEVKKAFAKCHQIIWKAEKINPQAAFVEFSKVLFIKLWEDRKLRDDPRLLALIGQGEPVPAADVRFSTGWISKQESDDPNPVADILFRQLVDFLEQEIARRKRKRIFEPGERLNLAAGTIKRVVAELEGFYLFGIDEDLNGRMFETFLTATMRGRELGQYFTPRSVVKLMEMLAQPEASPQVVERVLDACCGTGGFLIEVLADMRGQIYANTALSTSDRTRLLNEIANEAIFGIDAGKDPPVVRIARINMYLHGDGGSRIYRTDALREKPQASGSDGIEVRQEIEELERLLAGGLLFDVVLTNPPFSMDYSAEVPDEFEILKDYDLRTFEGTERKVLRSSVMFIERYWRLLKPGGRLLTVIDDGILNGPKYAYMRDFIRERFVIRGIISLHGDAFRGSGARVKTSVLYLTKRTEEYEDQPAAFVFESRYAGLDDVPPSTRPSVASNARLNADEERSEIVDAFQKYQLGHKGSWLVAGADLGDRLDAKFLLPWSVSELDGLWKKAGIESVTLADLVDPIQDVVDIDPDGMHRFLRISYTGYAEQGEVSLGSEVSYSRIMRAQQGDIVVSNISGSCDASVGALTCP